jgi:hypothetical protein
MDTASKVRTVSAGNESVDVQYERNALTKAHNHML